MADSAVAMSAKKRFLLEGDKDENQRVPVQEEKLLSNVLVLHCLIESLVIESLILGFHHRGTIGCISSFCMKAWCMLNVVLLSFEPLHLLSLKSSIF